MVENFNPGNMKNRAQAAADFAEVVLEAVWSRNAPLLQSLLVPGSNASFLFDMFGPEIFRVDLRIDLQEGEEKIQLKPYDLQIEGSTALLELGVLKPLKVETTGPEEQGHLQRLYGSSLLLLWNGTWQLAEVIPFNSDAAPDPQKLYNYRILALHRGKDTLPIQNTTLEEIEQTFLEKMYLASRFNLEERINALRLWRDFKSLVATPPGGKKEAWAGGVEYLITLFDFYEVPVEELSFRYSANKTAILNRSREIAQTLRVTQFDDRYSIHPDPVAHYRKIFGELGINPDRDERVRLAAERQKVFDTIEPVPDDDEDFFGPH